MENRLIIIDSNALLHRAFHALPPLAMSNGQETGAVYGYLLQQHFLNGGGYTAIFLEGSDAEVAALIRKFPDHVPPL